MNKLKLTVNKNLLKSFSVNTELKCSLKLSAIKAAEPKPVLMSYATYESTHSSTEYTPPLIILHGLFGSKGNWNSICKAFQRHCCPSRKVIAVDVRNHGDSPHVSSHTYEDIAADIKYFMDTQKIPKAILMGHSMGGKGVMCFALKYPELADKLIVGDISPITRSPTYGNMYAFFELMLKMEFEPNINLSTARIHADADLSNIISDKGVRAFLLTNLIKKEDGSYGWRINIPTLMSHFQNLASFPNLGAMKYEGRTLFLIGAMSDYVQKSDMIPIKSIFPNVEFITMPGTGHWLHSEKPKEFIDHVLGFIDEYDFPK